MRITKDMYVSGTAFFNNVTVFGTQSVAYISSSQLNIGTNIISVNTDTPSVRFGGLAVYDSGSTGLTGSMLWDSQDNQWIYSNPSGSEYDSAVFLVGPRNSGVLGNEPGISCNFLSKGNGLHHMTSSGIFEDGSRTCFYGNTVVSSSGTVCTTMANASCIGINTQTPFKRLTIDASDVASDGIAVRGNSSPAYILCETSGVGSTFTNDSAAGYIGTNTNHPFNVRSNSQNRLTFSNAGVACFACQVCTPSLISSGTICSTGNTCFGGTSIITGCLGVGTTPTQRLTVAGNVLLNGASTSLNFNTPASGNGDISFDGNALAVVSNSNSACLLLSTNSTARLQITSTGIACFACQVCAPRLEILRSSANNGLFIYSNSGATAIGCTMAQINGLTNDSTGNILTLASLNDGIRAVFRNDGNVGIGTATPANKLQIGSAGSSGYGGNDILIGNGTQVMAFFQSSTISNWYTNTNFAIMPAGAGSVGHVGIGTQSPSNRLTVSGNADITGNLGIGTTLPVAKLDIVSTGEGSEGLRVDGATGGFAFVVRGGSTYTSHIRAGATIGANYFTTPPSNGLIVEGNVGIGATAPSSLLHICGAGTGVMLRLQNTSTVSGDQGPLIQFMSANQVGGQNFESGYIQSIWTSEGNAFGMRFATKGVDASQSEKMRITSGGLVLIGTSTLGDATGLNDLLTIGKAGSTSTGINFTNGTATRWGFIYINNAKTVYGSFNDIAFESGASATERMRITSTGIACFACQVCAPSFRTNGGFYGCVFQGAGFSTLTGGAGTGNAIFDTVTRSDAALYEVSIVANPNGAGSGAYADFYYGDLLIGTGFDGSVKNFIFWCQRSTPPRSLYGSGGGNLTVNACMFYGGAEYSCVGLSGTYTIRFKINGYNSSATGDGTTIFLKQII
jgi:hypothetical protein